MKISPFPPFPRGLTNKESKKEVRRRIRLCIELGLLPQPKVKVHEVRS